MTTITSERFFFNPLPSVVLKSNHIFQDSEQDPISGVILINGETIQEIIPLISLTNENLLFLKTNCEFYDFEDSYIFPGLIDINVHLNSNYDEKWSHIKEVTQMAAQGGITTVIDNPIMNFYTKDFDEKKNIQSRINDLKGKINVDCGLLGYLNAQNYQDAQEIYEKSDILGFKLYLSRTMMHDLPFIEKKCLKGLFKSISKNSSLHKCLFAFDCVYVSDREKFMCSPLRIEPKEKRFDLSHEIINKTAGGVHESIETSEEFSSEIVALEQEIENIMEEYNSPFLKRVESNDEIDKLRIKANLIAKSQKENAIAAVEVRQYHQHFLINKLDDHENIEEIKKKREVSSDNDFSSSLKASSDEENEYLEKSTSTTTKKISDNLFASPKVNIPQQMLFFKEKSQDAIKAFSFHGNPLKEALRKIYKTLLDNAMDNEKDKEQEELKSNEKFKFSFQTQNKVLISGGKLFENIKPNAGPSSLLERRVNRKTVPNMNTSNQIKLKENLSKIVSIQVEKEENKEKEAENNRDYNIFLANHSLSWESNGIKLIFKHLKNMKNITILFSNLSSLSLFFMVKFFHEKLAPSGNVNLLTEVCTPYLYFHNKMIKPKQTKFKNSPPIRIKEERDLLIQGTKKDNLIDVVSSFHMSVPPEYKSIDDGNFRRSFDGFSSIGLNLQVLWTKLFIREKRKNIKNNEKEYMNTNDYDWIFKLLIKKMCNNPATILRIQNQKGSIKKDLHADIVVWKPFKIFKVEQKYIALDSPKNFLFSNRKVYGEITHTFLRGTLIYEIGGLKKENAGKIIRKI